MTTYRVDRAGEEPEFYSTWIAALAREKFLVLRGARNVVAWQQQDTTGPFVPPQEAGAA